VSRPRTGHAQNQVPGHTGEGCDHKKNLRDKSRKPDKEHQIECIGGEAVVRREAIPMKNLSHGQVLEKDQAAQESPKKDIQ